MQSLREPNKKTGVSFIVREAIEFGGRLPVWEAIHTKTEQFAVAHELAQPTKHTRHSTA